MENYASNRKGMTREERKRHVKVGNGISRPYVAAYVNVLQTVKDQPTPKKVDTIMEYAEDAEE